MRTYTELQRDDIIYNKRGIGYFVSNNAPVQIMKMRRKEFFEYGLPEFEHQVNLLKITFSDVESLIQKLKENENK
jgi:DNA-binding transcriptional regulator YhcF (GntR family)